MKLEKNKDRFIIIIINNSEYLQYAQMMSRVIKKYVKLKRDIRQAKIKKKSALNLNKPTVPELLLIRFRNMTPLETNQEKTLIQKISMKN